MNQLIDLLPIGIIVFKENMIYFSGSHTPMKVNHTDVCMVLTYFHTNCMICIVTKFYQMSFLPVTITRIKEKTNPKIRERALENLKQIAAGERDFRF